MKPDLDKGTRYFPAFDVAMTMVELTGPGYKPLLIFFTDGDCQDNETEYLKKIEEIKIKNEYTDFLGIGFGKDFYKGSVGY